MQQQTQPVRHDRMLDQIAQSGFVLVRNTIPIDQVERLQEALTESESGEATRRRGQFIYAKRDLLDAIPEARQFGESEAVRSLVEPVLGPNFFAVRGLFFDKTASANWKVTWHQDLTIVVR